MHPERPEPGLPPTLHFDIVKALIGELEAASVLSVGATTSASLQTFLDAGADMIYVIEPRPAALHALRSSFSSPERIRFLSDATAGYDGATSADVCGRSRAVTSGGTLPSRIGLVRAVADAGLLAKLDSLDGLTSAVVTIEPAADIPPTSDRAAFLVQADVIAQMARRGYANYVAIRQVADDQSAQINAPLSDQAELVALHFLHHDALPQVPATIFQLVAAAQQRLIERASGGLGAVSPARPSAATSVSASTDGAHELQARLDVLEEQEAALEAYLRIGQEDATWKWTMPHLGVLYQHDPSPFYVPEHYLTTATLAAPPVVSIVTPTMNSSLFVRHTIDSIVTQAYPNLEYIIQDGGSTDDTLDIVDQYRAKTAHVNSARDSGMSQAINRGFAHATGEIMAYLNSDDLLLPGSIHFAAHYFDRHPDVDVLYGHRVIINAHGEEIGRWVLPPHDSAVLSWADYVPQETMFWRRRLWEKVGGAVDETFRFALDWDLLLRFREAGATFARVPRFLGAFRVHEAQKTSRELEDLGASEMNRLRELYAGRPISAEEIWQNLQPYMYRHKAYHKLYRLGVLRY